ncbi:Down syndrome cell adhesion molecule-like protein Dscam2 [Centruroides sculpturatus]|uniref:Down syndrome cell adhesion molecule-like protein Dscam2 n=1 Tax=Centruroides sculpturatus TaxID=218467 RepID=UPI000C6D580A|nr:Down syndrome cell adhesion molecule-like protein Dscam2 [Centruroides sculpturatus]
MMIQKILLVCGVLLLREKSNGEVSDLPVIKPFNFQGRVPLQQKATAMCFVLLSSGPFKFQWSKDGKPISDINEAKINDNKEYSVIIIDPVKLTSEGNYTCTVSNPSGSSSYTANFLVAGKILYTTNYLFILLTSLKHNYFNNNLFITLASPQWQEEPQDVSSIKGVLITIHCSVTGSPMPNITWKKISNPSREIIEEVSKDRVLANGTLIIEEISEKDAGIYECEADNGIQPNIKKRITIKIYGM